MSVPRCCHSDVHCFATISIVLAVGPSPLAEATAHGHDSARPAERCCCRTDAVTKPAAVSMPARARLQVSDLGERRALQFATTGSLSRLGSLVVVAVGAEYP